MSHVLTGKSILVTGGTGSIGSELVRQALLEGAQNVIIFSRDEIKHFLIRKMLASDRLHTIVGYVRNIRSVEQVFTQFDVDIIYHTAAMKHLVLCEEFPLEAVLTNIEGTQNLIDVAAKYKRVSKIITISTDKAAYPANVLGATKFIAERITLNANRNKFNNQILSCVRFGNVACSRGSVIPVFIDNLLYKKPLQITNPEVTRFIMEIPDAVKLIIRATEQSIGGEIFILKMKAFKLKNLLDVLLEQIAPRLGILKQDIKIETTGLVPGEKLHEDLISYNEMPRCYELGDMYVILPEVNCDKQMAGIRKTEFLGYSSKDAEYLSNQDIENIIIKYLKSRSIIHN